jgi:transcription antitermination factor NusG
MAMAKDMNAQRPQGSKPTGKVEFAWMVVRTKQGVERSCMEALQHKSRGFEVYLPMFQKVDPKFNRTYPAPFIPNYLFVKVCAATPRWWSVYSTAGVHSVMGGEKPILIRDQALDAIRAKELEGFVQLTAPKKVEVPDWEKGQRLRIKGGAFEGMDALLEETVDEKRSWLLASLIGGSDSQALKIRVEWRDLIPA